MNSPRTRQLERRSAPRPTLRLEVVEGRDAALVSAPTDGAASIGAAERNTLRLKDPTVSRFHCELTVEGSGVRIVDLRSTNGTFVGAVRVADAIVPAGTVIRVGETSVRVASAEPGHIALYEGESLAGLVGRSTAMRSVMEQIQRVAPTSASVLIHGESGTGKELVAEAIHRLSPRAKRPFVVVDCASLVPTLVASELFGHERGAFTGADRAHVGAFERAHGGTLFLDEIGELPPALQPTLLGALERRRVRRLGGRSDIDVDVRVVCATNRDLRTCVNDASFRLDLYYRLAVVTLSVAPLRERTEDIEPLIEHFAHAMGHNLAVDELFSIDVLATLRAHRWPGNVRELRNVIEATIALGDARRAMASRDAAPSTSTSDASGWTAPSDSEPMPPYKDARASVLHRFERRYVEALIRRAEGNVSRAARIAGLDRGYVSDLLERHEIERK